jgi:hypothetical protein
MDHYHNNPIKLVFADQLWQGPSFLDLRVFLDAHVRRSDNKTGWLNNHSCAE